MAYARRVAGLVVVVSFFVIFVFVKAVSSSSSRSPFDPTQYGLASGTSDDYGVLVQTGIPARGILLWVNRTATKVPTYNRVAFEQRGMLIDVEIPGRAPYEVNTVSFVPVNLSRDVLPGCTVELRVDPNDPSRIAIVGPGVGFAQLMPPPPSPPSAS